MEETLIASETFVKKATFGLYENKTRAVSDIDPPKRKFERNERYQVAEKVGLQNESLYVEIDVLFIDADYFRRRKKILVIRLDFRRSLVPNSGW